MSEETFLVVDDFRIFREEFVQLLEAYGHHAIQAGDFASAMKAIKAASSLDGALLDLNLTEDGGEGVVIAETFREKFPGKPVISISSTPDQSWSDRPDISGNSGFEVIVAALLSA